MYLMLGGVGLGISYYNREYLKKKLMSNLWNMTRNYHIISIYLEDFSDIIEKYTMNILKNEHNYKKDDKDDKDDKDNQEENINIIQFNINTLEKNIYPIKNYIKIYSNLDYDILLIQKNKIYKRMDKLDIEKIKDLTFEKTNLDLFLSVELLYNNKTYDLTKVLKPYYVVGNKILDKKFIQWIMYTEYDIVNTEKYTINLIDNNVNMKQIHETNSIFIINKETYKIN